MAPVICRIISSNRVVWMCCRSCDSLHKSVCLYDGGVMPEERLTEDLLARLRAAASPQEYLDEEVTLDRTLSTYLHELLNEKRNENRRGDTRIGRAASYGYLRYFQGKMSSSGSG